MQRNSTCKSNGMGMSLALKDQCGPAEGPSRRVEGGGAREAGWAGPVGQVRP